MIDGELIIMGQSWVWQLSERRSWEVKVQCWPDEEAIEGGLRVLAVAGMSWAGNMMIWRRSLAFVAAAMS